MAFDAEKLLLACLLATLLFLLPLEILNIFYGHFKSLHNVSVAKCFIKLNGKPKQIVKVY